MRTLLLKHHKTAVPLIVLALVLLAYSNSFNAQFHLDDINKIVYNPAIKDISEVPRYFYDTGGAYSMLKLEFRPIKYITLALNYRISGTSPWSYHLFNLVLHLVNCLLVFLAVRLAARGGGEDDNVSYGIALASASVFALHPLQTGTVMYLSNGRSVLLASMFYLMGFISFARFRQSEGGGYAWAVLSPVFYMLGLLSKDTAVTLPAVALAYDWLISGRGNGGIKLLKERLRYYTAFASVLVLYVVWKQAIQGYTLVRENPYPVADYLMSEAKAFLLYVRLTFLPVNQNADYFLPLTTSLDLKSVLGFLALAAALAALFLYRKKEPVAVFFGCWFIILLMPESSLVTFRDVAVEYRLYLPVAGFIAAACTLASHRRVVVKNMAVTIGLLALLLALFTTLCLARNTAWRTEVSFWRDAVAKSPWSARAHTNLGRALLISKDYPAAISEFERSLDVDPDYVQKDVTQFNLGMCYYETGDFNNAITHFEASLADNPSYLESYNKLGESLFILGRYDESAAVYWQAYDRDGCNTVIQYNLATALMMSGQDAEAQAHLEDLLEYGFDNFDVRYNLALIYQRRGEKARALEQAGIAESKAADPASRARAEALAAELGG